MTVAPLAVPPDPAWAQEVSFTPLFSARECRVLLPVGDRIYGGLADGGLYVWHRDDPQDFRRLTTVEGLNSNAVADLDWSGSHLWAATDAGLTRIADPGTADPDLRQFTNLGGLGVTAVAGVMLGQEERVYYSFADDFSETYGLGVINSGLPGGIFTAEDSPGLVDDRITDLAFLGEDLWIGTQDGISRFRGNIFTDLSAGLPHRHVRCMHASGDTLLLIGTMNGVAVWNQDAGGWERLGDLGGWIDQVTVVGNDVWALGAGDAIDRLRRWDGAQWTSYELPEPYAAALGGGEDLWTAGRLPLLAGQRKSERVFLARRDGDQWAEWLTDAPFFTSAGAAAFDADGNPWFGATTGEGIAGLVDGVWNQLYEPASAGNDSLGLLNTSGNIFDMVALPGGEIWATQFTSGALRYRPGLPDCDHVTSFNSGLTDNRLLRLLAHPDGPLLFLGDTSGADVLLAPERWADPAAWIHLPTDASGLGGGDLRGAVVERRDRIWFTVKNVGLVLWDVNGSEGPDGAMTWLEPADDIWTPALESAPGTDFAFPSAVTLAVDADGSLWAGGGNGVVHFDLVDYADDRIEIGLRATYGQKLNPLREGLISSDVRDLAFDRNGDLWVAHARGLNRIREVAGGVEIDPFTSLAAYIEDNLGTLYSPSAVSGLPGGAVLRLAPDAEGGRLLVAGEGGALIVDVPRRGAGGDLLAGIYLYPNPLRVDQGQELRLGGLPGEGRTVVDIFSIEGQPVFRRTGVTTDTIVWDGRNRLGESVSAGPYLVRIEYEGSATVRTLAVIR